MNRQQAEHILDAYVRMRMRENDEYDEDASDALREVILDSMTDYMISGVVITPETTWQATTPNRSSNWDGTPKITCTGVDPAFRTNTAEAVE